MPKVGFEYSDNLKFIFAKGGDLRVIGRELSDQEAYIVNIKYLAEKFHTFPWQWDPEYPCEDRWCPEDFNTFFQCEIAVNNRLSRSNSQDNAN